MSTVCEPLQSNCVESFLKHDLASLSCRAAGELDALRLNRQHSFSAIESLLTCLDESIVNVTDPSSPSSLLNPTTAVIVNAAIGDVRGEGPLNHVTELVTVTSAITRRLKELLSDPEGFRDGNFTRLAEMQDFCLALSKRAFGLKRSRNDTGYQHPYRR